MGRPRKRCLDESLELALRLFWDRGYEGTSIGELSAALGVGPSSLYNDFGSKERLYRACIERYVARESRFIREALATPDAADALVAMLQRAPEVYTRPDCPAGCAVLNAPRMRRTESEVVDGFLRALRERTLGAIRERVARGVDEGQLRADVDPEALARFVYGILAALSNQARDGAGPEPLRAMLAHAEDAIEAARA